MASTGSFFAGAGPFRRNIVRALVKIPYARARPNRNFEALRLVRYIIGNAWVLRAKEQNTRAFFAFVSPAGESLEAATPPCNLLLVVVVVVGRCCRETAFSLYWPCALVNFSRAYINFAASWPVWSIPSC